MFDLLVDRLEQLRAQLRLGLGDAAAVDGTEGTPELQLLHGGHKFDGREYRVQLRVFAHFFAFPYER